MHAAIGARADAGSLPDALRAVQRGTWDEVSAPDISSFTQAVAFVFEEFAVRARALADEARLTLTPHQLTQLTLLAAHQAFSDDPLGAVFRHLKDSRAPGALADAIAAAAVSDIKQSDVSDAAAALSTVVSLRAEFPPDLPAGLAQALEEAGQAAAALVERDGDGRITTEMPIDPVAFSQGLEALVHRGARLEELCVRLATLNESAETLAGMLASLTLLMSGPERAVFARGFAVANVPLDAFGVERMPRASGSPDEEKPAFRLSNSGLRPAHGIRRAARGALEAAGGALEPSDAAAVLDALLGFERRRQALPPV